MSHKVPSVNDVHVVRGVIHCKQGEGASNADVQAFLGFACITGQRGNEGGGNANKGRDQM